MERYKWYSGCGRLTLSLPKDVVELCYHSGDCTEDLERCMEWHEPKDMTGGTGASPWRGMDAGRGGTGVHLWIFEG